ncbi:P-loop containing nucleoside triphosphate hydrolase protein, partial [Blyttiomyces helicus]
MTAKEILANASSCISLVPPTPGTPATQVVIGTPELLPPPGGGGGPTRPDGFKDPKSFTFDHVFDHDRSQQELYRECVEPLVDRFMEGFNATVLAYGQTGSGKTYSMGTGLDDMIEEERVGIVPRAISYLFESLTAQADRAPDEFKYKVFVSFLELYNEDLVDLLNPRSRDASGGWGGLTIREDGMGNIVWQGVKEEEVDSPEELLGYLQRGSLCRTTASTEMNASSSRSHAIFSVILKQERWAGGSWHNLVSKFHFVDLAGSERLKRTQAEGDRKKEGISINQGLLALGNVISALGDETRKASHVPYRDSKLTRMLQDSLGGNSQTLFLTCVSPSDTNYGESVNTLNYANRAKNIKNRAVVNRD